MSAHSARASAALFPLCFKRLSFLLSGRLFEGPAESTGVLQTSALVSTMGLSHRHLRQNTIRAFSHLRADYENMMLGDLLLTCAGTRGANVSVAVGHRDSAGCACLVLISHVSLNATMASSPLLLIWI